MFASRMLRNVSSSGRGFWRESGLSSRTGDYVMFSSILGMGTLCGLSYWLGYREIGNSAKRRGVSETVSAFNDDMAKTLRT